MATKTTALWEIYDPKTDRWTKGGILPAPRKNHACALAKSKIYLSGGLSEGEGQRNVWLVFLTHLHSERPKEA